MNQKSKPTTKPTLPQVNQTTQTGKPIVNQDTQTGKPIVNQDTEIGKPLVNQDTETGKPQVNQTTQTGKPIVNQDTQTGKPIVNQDTEIGKPLVNQDTETGKPQVNLATETGLPLVNQATETGLPWFTTGKPLVNQGKPPITQDFDWLKKAMTTSLNTDTINWIKENVTGVSNVTQLIGLLIKIANQASTALDTATNEIETLSADLKIVCDQRDSYLEQLADAKKLAEPVLETVLAEHAKSKNTSNWFNDMFSK